MNLETQNPIQFIRDDTHLKALSITSSSSSSSSLSSSASLYSKDTLYDQQKNHDHKLSFDDFHNDDVDINNNILLKRNNFNNDDDDSSSSSSSFYPHLSSATVRDLTASQQQDICSPDQLRLYGYRGNKILILRVYLMGDE